MGQILDCGRGRESDYKNNNDATKKKIFNLEQQLSIANKTIAQLKKTDQKPSSMNISNHMTAQAEKNEDDSYSVFSSQEENKRVRGMNIIAASAHTKLAELALREDAVDEDDNTVNHFSYQERAKLTAKVEAAEDSTTREDAKTSHMIMAASTHGVKKIGGRGAKKKKKKVKT